MKRKIGAVIIGSDFQALGAIRSLAENEVPVFVVEHEMGISRYSRYVKKIVKNYEIFSNGLFPEFLIRLAKDNSLAGWVLYPNNDESVKLLSIYRDVLKDWYKVSVPGWDVIKKIYYKEAALEIAEKASIPIPKLYRGANLDDYLKLDLKFPLVLKPSYKEKYFPRTRKKAVRVNNRTEFIKEFELMSTILQPAEIVVQEMILGGPKNLYSYATVFDGQRALGGMVARRLRQHPMDFGQATTYAISVKEPELEFLACKLLKEIGYSGIAEVEFMKDERDGLFKFIEINGRVWGWHTLAKATGINLPFYLYQSLVGEEIENKEAIEGVKWVRLLTDIPTVAKEIIGRRMTVIEYFESLKGKKEFAVFSKKDPLPFIAECAYVPYLWYKRGF